MVKRRDSLNLVLYIWGLQQIMYEFVISYIYIYTGLYIAITFMQSGRAAVPHFDQLFIRYSTL